MVNAVNKIMDMIGKSEKNKNNNTKPYPYCGRIWNIKNKTTRENGTFQQFSLSIKDNFFK